MEQLGGERALEGSTLAWPKSPDGELRQVKTKGRPPVMWAYLSESLPWATASQSQGPRKLGSWVRTQVGGPGVAFKLGL